MSNYLPGFNFPIYSGWNAYTPVIPKMYWNAYSIEQILKQLACDFDKCEHYLDYVAEKMNEWGIDFDEEIESQFEAMWYEINNGLENAAHDWIANNLEWIFTHVVKQVFFGLTMDGHFVAYIPDGWEDIVFDTGMVYGRSDYGRLILRFNTDDEGAIDNTYSYSLAQEPDIYEQLISDLEVDAQRTDACYDTLFTNLDEEV